MDSRLFGSAPEKRTKNMPLVRCYLDFDGTLTGVTGGKTVQHKLYRACWDGNYKNYAEAEFIPAAGELLRKAFAVFDTTGLEIQDGALKFLKKMLVMENAEIIILSRNRKEYIQAVMTAQGFTDQEIQKIQIHGIKSEIYNNSNKHGAASKIERLNLADIAIVADDDFADQLGMKNGICDVWIAQRKWPLYTQAQEYRESDETPGSLSESVDLSSCDLGSEEDSSEMHILPFSVENRIVLGCHYDIGQFDFDKIGLQLEKEIKKWKERRIDCESSEEYASSEEGLALWAGL